MSQAIRLLEERFARGEISADEYRRRLKVLVETPAAAPKADFRAELRKALPVAQLQGVELKVWMLAALGVISAVAGWVIEQQYRTSDHQVIEYFGRWSYGVIFAVIVGGVLYNRMILSSREWALMIVATGLGYISARSLVENASTDSIRELAMLGAVASTIGATFVFAALKLTRRKVFASWRQLLAALALLAVIGAAMIAIALSIEAPTRDWPKDISLMLFIHVPWQAAFSVILLQTLKTAPRRSTSPPLSQSPDAP